MQTNPSKPNTPQQQSTRSRFWLTPSSGLPTGQPQQSSVSPKRRKAIFQRGYSRESSNQKSLHAFPQRKPNNNMDSLASLDPVRKVQQQQTAQNLIREISGVLATLKNKYNLYMQTEQQNVLLKQENGFLKSEVERLRVSLAQRQGYEDELKDARQRNRQYRGKMQQARRQIGGLKKLFLSQDIEKSFDSILALLN